MAGAIWVIGEVTGAGALTKLSGEAATAARALGEAGGRAVVGVVVAAEPDTAAASLAAFLPNVVAVRAPEASGRAGRCRGGGAGGRTRGRHRSTPGVLPPRRDARRPGRRRDALGTAGHRRPGERDLRRLGGMPQADVPEGPRVEVQPWGGRLRTRSAFTADTGIILLRPNMVTAAPLATPGRVAEGLPRGVADVPVVRVVDRVAVASAGSQHRGGAGDRHRWPGRRRPRRLRRP